MKVKNLKIIPGLCIVGIIYLLICGFIFNEVKVTIDTDDNPVYEYCTSATILSYYADKDNKSANKYNGGFYVISGIVNERSKKGDRISLVSSIGAEKHVNCTVPMELRNDALGYNKGDAIAVFGKVKVDLIDKEVHVSVDKIIKSPGSKPAYTYYVKDGTNYTKSSLSKQTLNDGQVSYYIPMTWKNVEHSIQLENLGSIEGYQYVLNKLQGSESNIPESLFVCYFHNGSKLENQDDARETKLIERAIIKNISEEHASSFRSRELTTYYKTNYHYYIGKYTDLLDAGSNGYRVEYVFQKDGEEGLIMYLYVYKKPLHLSDIMFVTRFLEMK